MKKVAIIGGETHIGEITQLAGKELEIVGSRVSLGSFQRTLELMTQNRFHPDLVVSREFKLDQTDEAFRLLEENPEEYLKILIEI